MDMGASFNKSVRAEGHAPQAVICIDPFYADLRIMPMSGPKALVVAVSVVVRSA